MGSPLVLDLESRLYYTNGRHYTKMAPTSEGIKKSAPLKYSPTGEEEWTQKKRQPTYIIVNLNLAQCHASLPREHGLLSLLISKRGYGFA